MKIGGMSGGSGGGGLAGGGPRVGNRICRGVAIILLGSFVLGWIYLALMAVYDLSPQQPSFVGESAISNKYGTGSDNHLPSYDVSSAKDYHQLIPGLIYDEDRRSRQLFGNVAPRLPDFFRLGDLLREWPPDVTDPAYWQNSEAYPDKGKGVIRLDYSNREHVKIAYSFRDADMPFVLYNVPELQRAATQFSRLNLLNNFGATTRNVEKSKNNHFMYYKQKDSQHLRKSYPDWTPPQLEVPMTFSKFLQVATEAENTGPQAGSLSLSYLTINAAEVSVRVCCPLAVLITVAARARGRSG
jgi:hypothetical protein